LYIKSNGDKYDRYETYCYFPRNCVFTACQKPGDKLDDDTMHVQIINEAYLTNSVRNSNDVVDDDLANNLCNFSNIFESCARPSCAFIVFDI